MRYVEAKTAETADAEAYRFYIAEGLKVLTGNTARFAGGTELKLSLSDVLSRQKRKPDNRTAAQIIRHMKEKLGKIGRG